MTVVQVSNGNGTISDQMGTFCLILYNPTGVSTIFDEMGSLKLIIYIKNIYSLLMNSLDDRSVSFYLLSYNTSNIQYTINI